MRAVFLTLAAFVGGPVAADPVLDFTGGTQQSFAFDTTVGWKFTVGSGSTITIGGLGIFDFGAGGLKQTHQIGLWTGTGSLLRSTTITNANSTPVASTSPLGNWRSTPLTSSLQLTAGDYVVGAFYLASSPDIFLKNATATTITGVAYNEYRAARGSSLLFPDTFVGETGAGFFGPNLFTATTPVPEPTSLILLGSGLAGLAGRFAWRKRRPKQGEKPSAV
jgi:hypothetical protein